MTQLSTRGFEGASPAIPCSDAGVDLESVHKVFRALLEALQGNFKREMQYPYPLMSPEANVAFALDGDTAERMIAYMTAKLLETGDFNVHEFSFSRKRGMDGETVQRIRLGFRDGVDARVIRKLALATEMLKGMLPSA